MRILATLGVVFIHTCNTLANNAEDFMLTSSQRVSLNCMYSLMHWSVPMFFMITGALLLREDRQVNVRLCFSKYIKRIVLAIIVFGLPFSCAEVFLQTREMSIKTLFLSAKMVVEGNSWGHLWYLYMLLGIYIVLPIIHSYACETNKTETVLMLAMLFFVELCIPIIEKVTGVDVAIPNNSVGYSVFYMLAGRYCYCKNFLLSKHKRTAALSLIGCIIVILCCNGLFGVEAMSYLGYNSPIVAVMTISIFVLLKGVEISTQCKNFVWKCDRLCFGVYLVHPVFTNAVYKFANVTPFVFREYWVIGVPMFFMGFSLLGFFTSAVLHRIKPLRDWVL